MANEITKNGSRTIWSQDLYNSAWLFASYAHNQQKMPGSELPYIHHVASVAMEVMTAIVHHPAVKNPDLAVQCALLHDTIEDTATTYDDVKAQFGNAVADGVLALSKNPALATKTEQMRDSLKRIQQQPREIWLVKLADRITNLQKPPHYWDKSKIARYRREAMDIHSALAEASTFLASRLQHKIDLYKKFLIGANT